MDRPPVGTDWAKIVAKTLIAAGLVWVWPGPRLVGSSSGTEPAPPVTSAESTALSPRGMEVDWFRRTRAACNPVEVEARLRRTPPPASLEGRAYEAACLALAGRIDRARGVIEELPAETRWRAAGIVFDQAHPVADAGDESAAGPVMELVVEFWPNHYMALYHAGASRFEAGDAPSARDYLERFLAAYAQDDGWTRNAAEMLERLPPA